MVMSPAQANRGDTMGLPTMQRTRGLLLAASLAATLLLPATAARAHFLWLTAERDGPKVAVRAFLSETPAPDLPEFLKHIDNARFSADGKPLERSRDGATFLVRVPEPTPPVVDGA